MLKKISYTSLIISIAIFVATQNIVNIPIISNNSNFFQTIGLVTIFTYLVTLVIRIIKALLVPIIIVLSIVMLATFSSTPQGTKIMNKASECISTINVSNVDVSNINIPEIDTFAIDKPEIDISTINIP